ncbi:MAG: peptidase S53, partial [Massilia sp.]|nr:peptidase S53 [Massilia sp.]
MVKLQGSVPTTFADMRSLGPAPADERCDITVLVRRRAPLAPHALETMPGQRRYLTRAEFAARHGASDADLDAVAAFAHQAGLVVVERRPAARSIVLSG